MIERIIKRYEDEPSTLIKLQLLTATMKLFFKRPPEMQHMLGRLLELVLNEVTMMMMMMVVMMMIMMWWL
jgi:AP-4 complex subunit beta-1